MAPRIAEDLREQMIVRLAANEQEIDQALDVCLVNEPSVDPADRDAILDHWLMMHTYCPEGFWIAQEEASHQIIGVASAVRLPPQWILANFYVLPAYHGMGIGKKLLDKIFSIREGCNRLLVHASSHPSAQSLYIQLGMVPLPYSMMFKGQPHHEVTPATLTVEECPVAEILRTLNTLDQQALGFTRDSYHRWWAKKGNYFLVKQDDQVVAYFRVSEGMIGPLVVSNERWMTAALDWAIVKQKEISSGPHEIFVPGVNTAAIGHLFARGYRFHDLNLLLSSHPMPGLARVIFHDTDLL